MLSMLQSRRRFCFQDRDSNKTKTTGDLDRSSIVSDAKVDRKDTEPGSGCVTAPQMLGGHSGISYPDNTRAFARVEEHSTP